MPKLVGLAVVLTACASSVPPVQTCPEPEPVAPAPVAVTRPEPLASPVFTSDDMSASVLGFEVMSPVGFGRAGGFPGMSVTFEVTSETRTIVALSSAHSVIRSVRDDMGATLWGSEGPKGQAGPFPGIRSEGLDDDRRRRRIKLGFPIPTLGAREVLIDADIAVMVGSLEETFEGTLKLLPGESISLDGAVLTVDRVESSPVDGAQRRVVLRAPDPDTGIALMTSMELSTDEGPVRIMGRSHHTALAPEERFEIRLDLQHSVPEVTVRARLPGQREVVVIPIRARIGIGSVVADP